MKTSVYLMQLRVLAQGSFVACIAIGVGLEAMNDKLKEEKTEIVKSK